MSTGRRTPATMPVVLAALLVASAAVFAVGVSLERRTSTASHGTAKTATHTEVGEAQHSTAPTATPAAGTPSPAATPTEAGTEEATAEPSESSEAGSPVEPSTAAGDVEGSAAEGSHVEGGHSERVFGVPTETPGTIAVVVAVSLLLAALVLRRLRRIVLVAVVAFAAGAAILDIGEVARQLGEHRAGLVVLAGLVAVLHIAVVAAAVLLWPSTAPRTG